MAKMTFDIGGGMMCAGNRFEGTKLTRLADGRWATARCGGRACGPVSIETVFVPFDGEPSDSSLNRAVASALYQLQASYGEGAVVAGGVSVQFGMSYSGRYPAVDGRSITRAEALAFLTALCAD